MGHEINLAERRNWIIEETCRVQCVSENVRINSQARSDKTGKEYRNNRKERVMKNHQYTDKISPIQFKGKTFLVDYPDGVIQIRIEDYLQEHGGVLQEEEPDYLICQPGSVHAGNVILLTPVQFWIGAGEYDRLQKSERKEEALIFLASDTEFSNREQGNIYWYIRENKKEIFDAIMEENSVDALNGYLNCYREIVPERFSGVLTQEEYAEQILLDLVDELIETATMHEKHELKAWLLEYKKVRFSDLFVEEIQQAEFEKELGFRDRNEYDWLKLFSFTEEEEGIYIREYKGTDDLVFIPDEINGRPIMGIAVRNFFASDRTLQFCWQRPQALQSVIDRQALAEARVGDEITFGHYPQERTGKSLEIQWKVLKREHNRLLVISKYCLDKIPYHMNMVKTTWSECNLRTWFNGPFFQLAFTEEEQAMIPEVIVSSDTNEKYKTTGGKETTDHIFALSIQEAESCFSSDNDRIGYTTLYAQAQGFYFGGKINCWWLRTPGVSLEFTALVGNSGSVGNYGYRVDHNEYAVRPAMWITID